MNQKNMFTAFSAILVLQGVFFYLMKDKVVNDAFINLDETGKNAAMILMDVLSALFIAIGLISYAMRNTQEILGAYTAGFTVLVLITLKHYFVDHINVPIPAMIIQFIIVLISAYLWMQSRKTQA